MGRKPARVGEAAIRRFTLLFSLVALSFPVASRSQTQPCNGGTIVTGPSGTQSQPFQAGAGATCATNTASFAIGQTIVVVDPAAGAAYGLNFYSRGPAGAAGNGKQDGGNGGNSGFLQATNSGSITIGGTQTAFTAALLLTGAGGNGGNATENGYYGGGGGSDAGGISTGYDNTNTGPIVLDPATYQKGAAGVLVYSTGGNGGLGYSTSDDGTNAGGGPGGSGGGASMVNAATGSIAIGTSAAAASGNGNVYGIAVISRAGAPGGVDNFGSNADNNGNGQDGRNGRSGQGGSSGIVSVTNAAPIGVFWNGGGATQQAYGIYALSAGGTGIVLNGGSGSPNTGGNGGAAAAVTVTHTGNITVLASGLAANAAGATIGATSRGGDGGPSWDSSTTAGIGAGAGAVSVTAAGTLLAQGQGVAGIRAASLGGSGGDGIDNAGLSTHNINGGAGGDAGAVSVTLQSGAISTNGNQAFGIGVVSMGGSGGAGNDFDDPFGTTTGSNGGNGGSAADVSVTTPSGVSVSTQGPASPAIAAQSIGGPGGAAGDITKVFGATAGTPGAAGAVGTVTLTNSGSLGTTGSGSFGILAQSIAASGAAGGTSSGLFYAQGGAGGAGGSGAAVTVANNGSVATTGASAHAVIVQSIGGGGGAAGAGVNSLVGLGGSATTTSQSSNGGTILVTNNGSLSTAGGSNPNPGQPPAGTTSYGNAAFTSSFAATFSNAAVGILAQSIGGGGGDGGGGEGLVAIGGSGASGGGGGQVTVDNTGSIATTGQQSHGIVAQSIGGGGGNGGSALAISPTFVTVAIGGSGAQGGAGGPVTVNQTGGSITTTGPLAAGIVAQSIGGGGGIGGAGNAYTVGAPIAAVAVAVGGSGGSGATTQPVTVNISNTTISTGNPYSPPPTQDAGSTSNLLPADSYGVLVQSIAGGGGKGGTSIAQAMALAVPLPVGGEVASFAASTSVSVGGTGGTGSIAGAAIAVLGPGTSIITQGQGGHGVAVQSIGGGGGDGGASSALSATIGYGRAGTATGTQVVSADVSVAVGGNGNVSGNGAAALFNAEPAVAGKAVSITTYGDFADGVLVQSIGGGGGNAGTGSGTTQNWGSTLNYSVGVGVGGTGGAGGNGGEARAILGAGNTVSTYGSSAHGIVVQSIGGGGGNSQGVQVMAGVSAQFSRNPDGNFIFADPTVNATPGFSFGVNVGQNGAAGGNGGQASAFLAGTIATVGDGAFGALVQSIGGGGGQGGSFGSDASADNPVQVLNSLRSFTTNVATLNLKLSVTAGVSVGGSGGGGGDGGAVIAGLGGTITTQGDWSTGVVAQSIGGGGGVGGGAQLKGGPAILQGSTFVGSGVQFDKQLNVTGSPGPGGHGGTVTILPTKGSVSTAGYAAFGVLGQSIGGGGGFAVTGSDYQTPTGSGTYLTGVSATSIYLGNYGNTPTESGLGGQPGDGGAVSLPGNAPDGSGGSVPTVTTIATAGQAAHALVLQSIGGGGGIGGAGNSSTGTAGSFALFVGGGTDSNGGGGPVSADGKFAISTAGTSAYGIVLQSIGGGGGMAFVPSIGATANVELGGRSTHTSAPGGSFCASSANNPHPQANCGGPVSLAMAPGSAITTAGAGAHAIVAQSIGGGGGIANFSPGDQPLLLAGPTSQFNSVGNGQAVSITTNGTIAASGAGAYGILAQSIGGGGGLGDGGKPIAGATGSNTSAEVTGGPVTIVQNGTIQASGVNGVAIFAQSTSPGQRQNNGGPGDGAISVTVNGAVSGGSGVSNATAGATSIGGAGIWIDGGNNANIITVSRGGSLAAAGVAIGTSGGYDLWVDNYGSISGSVISPNNLVFQNQFGATVQAGATMNADMTNAGTLFIGTGGTVGTTLLTGRLVQTATGRLVADVDFATGVADRLVVKGLASLSGQLVVVPSSLLPRSSVDLIALEGPVGAMDIAEVSSPLVRYGLSRTTNRLSVHVASADFAPASIPLNGAQSAVATGLQSVWNAGGNAGFGKLFAALSNAAAASTASYRQALDQLSPGASLALGARQGADAFGFANALLSCPDFAGTTAHVVETECGWARMVGRHTVNSGGGVPGSTIGSTTLQIGGQHAIGDNLFLSGALAYQNSWLASANGSVSGSGQTGYAGGALKWQPGPWLVALSALGSYGSFQTSRSIALPGFGGIAKASPDQATVAARLRVAYNIWDDNWYVRPMVNLDLIHSRVPGYVESGPEIVRLRYATATQTGFVGTPALEVGRRFNLEDGAMLRAYGSLGVSLLSNPSWETQSWFVGAPAGAAGFTTRVEGDRAVGRITLGLQLLTMNQLDLRAQYDGDLAENSRSHAGSLTFALRF